MALAGSMAVVALIIAIQTTLSRWRLLHRGARPPWIDASAGAALAYVFAYLIPKLASSQEKFTDVAVSDAAGFVQHQMYLLAMAGLVIVYWLESATERANLAVAAGGAGKRWSAILLAGGYGLYFLQLGYLLADMPRPEANAYLLTGLVLGLHVMGLVHRVRQMDPRRYERTLRWTYAGLTLLGWLIGVLTHLPATVVMIFSALIAGGIMIIALREELPNQGKARFPPFLASIILTTLAILWVQAAQATP